jgi:uncharacterized membrane protein YagU involved in acid resistance
MEQKEKRGPTFTFWQGAVSGFILGFFSPWIWAPIIITVTFVSNVLVFRVRRTRPDRRFGIALLIGIILGFISFLVVLARCFSGMGAIG